MAEKKEKRYVSDNVQLMAEWDWDKNVNLDPSQLTLGSHKHVYWKCIKGHKWESEIKIRNKGFGCPYCSGRRPIKGETDLQAVSPDLANEWHCEKNGNLRPTDVLPNSGKKVWWKCAKGHEWQAKIYSRNNGTGCPICHSERNTSFPEYALLYYLKKHFLEVLHSYKTRGYELDIYIPSCRIAIEYDGYFWHKNKTSQDIEKNKWCVKDGITLYRIREGLPSLNDTSNDYVIQRNQKDLSKAIIEILTTIIGNIEDVDLERDAISIENLREYSEKENSILLTHPEVANEWNYEKNGSLRPEHLTINSHKKVWWKCSEGHEWAATIDNRHRGHGCPYCSGRTAISGINDLQTVNPTLASEWLHEKNGLLTPVNILPNSGKTVWWKCKKGHEWKATIASRNSGVGCPYCSGKKVLKGYNDLKTLNPTLAIEWNYKKNGDLTPEDVTIHSSKSVWWVCSKGHEWQSIIENRTKGNGCPYCSGRKVLKGYNDLLTVNPILAHEWNCQRNGNLTPEDVTSHSNRRVWWKCSNGHEWLTKVNHRSNGSGCPECARQNRKKSK